MAIILLVILPLNSQKLFLSFTITTSDNVALSTIEIFPEKEIKAIVQFHAGTVIKKEFYLKFARYLAELGYGVVLFDYRGVGGSRPKSLRGYNAAISDWGRYDAPAVLEYIKEQYPDLPHYLFAHSMGGQLIGMMHNAEDFEKIVVVASSSGNWHNFAPAYRKKIQRMTALLPFVAKLFGYIPGWLGFGDDWPKEVAMEWYENSKRNMKIADFVEGRFDNTYYKSLRTKINAVFFSDDHMATPNTMPNYIASYPNADVVTHLIRPEEYHLDKIGHFGLFKEFTFPKLWEDVAALLDQKKNT